MNKEKHDFTGKHLMANYMGCNNEALNNIGALELIMRKGCEESKATVLNLIKHTFPVENSSMIGVSMVLILSESHASIHTYPEFNSCFVDFFTCGTSCLPNKFDEILQNYLKPDISKTKLFLRDEKVIKEHLKAQDKQKDSKNHLQRLIRNFVG